MKNPGLEAAVQVFKDLGWADATPDQVMSLPLGTKEQQRTASDGLSTGDWGTWGQLSPTHYGYLWRVDADETMLALFAIRVGVDAGRAVEVLEGLNVNNELVLAVVEERGAEFAGAFIEAACTPGRRRLEHELSVYGAVAVCLVAQLDMPVPANVEYVKDWAAQVALSLGLIPATGRNDSPLPDRTALRDGFAQHVRVGIAVRAPATGPFADVFRAGVERGWLDRVEAVDLVFAAIDQSVRPGDRKAWLNMMDWLGVTDEDLVARADTLVPLLGLGDSTTVARFAPVLISRASDAAAVEALLAALTISVRKTQRLVLDAALSRARPAGAEEVAPQLSALASDRDKAVSSRAARLMDHWRLTGEIAEPEAECVRGLWQPTPDVWAVPRFNHGPETPEALTALAAALTGRPGRMDRTWVGGGEMKDRHDSVADVEAERFLAVANAVARSDESAARRALRGVRSPDVYGLSQVRYWVTGKVGWPGKDVGSSDKAKHFADPLCARETAVFQRLGRIPCVLSEPSWDDLRIDAADLVSRLESYVEAGVDCLEGDLLLALLRVDPTTVTPGLLTRLSRLQGPMVLGPSWVCIESSELRLVESGILTQVPAGVIAAGYLVDPVVEPPLEIDNWNRWGLQGIQMPASLRDFPDRLTRLHHYHRGDLYAIFPHWGDSGLQALGWPNWLQHSQGLVLRQVARRAVPLPPGAAVNMLAAQRSPDPGAAEDSALAVTEAWQRGLLRPGVADVRYMDWGTTPSNLAALATTLADIAQTGLLSVVWAVLYDLVAASMRAPRLISGTAEILEAMAGLLDEVTSAVATGGAESVVLNLPAVRDLANRSGSSRAVSLAREIVARLPVEPLGAAAPAPTMDPSFEAVWQYDAGQVPEVADGVDVSASWANTQRKKVMRLRLTLPDSPERCFLIDVPGEWYDDWVKEKGEYRAWAFPISEADAVGPGLGSLPDKPVYLDWDTSTDRLVPYSYREWREREDRCLTGATPLSSALVAVVVAIAGYGWNGSAVIKNLMGERRIGSQAVAAATRMLLRSPDVGPSHLVRAVEKDVYLLPVLWPILTESVAHAGSLPGNPPAWLSRVLSVALSYAPYLAEASRRGLISAEAAQWPGLADIASRPGKSAAIAKAKELKRMVRP